MAVTLTGVLKDPYGQPLPGATIRFDAVRTSATVLNHIRAEAITDAQGDYSISVEVGRYDVRVMQGRSFLELAKNLEVRADSTATDLNELVVEWQGEQDLTPGIVIEFRALVDEARGYRDEAVASAGEAAASESNAADSASAANESASNAATSEHNAANSASAASALASSASDSADAASTSEANAASSASAAAASEGNAATSASNAASAASAAAASESNAAGSESAAAASEADAAQSATDAAASAASIDAADLVHAPGSGLPNEAGDIYSRNAAEFDAAGSAASAESAAKSYADTKATEAQAHAVQRSNHTGTQTLATISDAGTAASRDVATTETDKDTSKIARVGAAGLISSIYPPSPTSFTHNLPTGLYGLNVSAAQMAADELPVQYGTVLSCGHPSNARNYSGWGQQILFGNNGKIYQRRSAENSVSDYTSPINWHKWSFLYSNRNAVQSVGMDADGVPSGGLLERGSNSNGEFLRFADGTLICFIEVDGLGTTTAVPGSNGSLFHSADQTWTFPAAFVDKPVMGVTGIRHSDDSIIVWGVGRTTTGSTAKLRGVASQSSAAIGYYLHATAKGRWYN
ncbi:carboxypeptidase regulatory-like domain-containing protein [Halomonas sp.]|uniref:carboxypeptidase regulatory-like domain-containing protein n=1 Tax=Halomonas sp. TaxID=1486246 RepID=UPI000C90C04F|nr:carboxypeptidase regulatory-like domain-containing protein [Halomonas sp.]MAR74352.1 hypothetical protein [Halomonas sp.]|tara:strand:- start:5424 stop:7163 length:1740 start_codon:yes stop_codon:yes gene_type:complete